MVNFHCMKKIFKLFIASLLTVSLGVATVVCCCIAPTLTTFFHKATVCSHCPDQNSHHNSSNPAGTCQQQLTSAEFLHPQTISSPIVSANPFPVSVFSNNHQLNLTHSLLVYPPGGSSPGFSFAPLYLRTFNLRV